LGDGSPALDAEIILVAKVILENIGLSSNGLEIYLNSIGCHKCRPIYTRALVKYYHQHTKELCERL